MKANNLLWFFMFINVFDWFSMEDKKEEIIEEFKREIGCGTFKGKPNYTKLKPISQLLDAMELAIEKLKDKCSLEDLAIISTIIEFHEIPRNQSFTDDQFLEIASKRCAKIIKEFLN